MSMAILIEFGKYQKVPYPTIMLDTGLLHIDTKTPYHQNDREQFL